MFRKTICCVLLLCILVSVCFSCLAESVSENSSSFTAIGPMAAYTRIEKVNVRQKADGSSKLVEQLARAGTKVTVTGQGEDEKGVLWYAVRLEYGKTGYVRADLLTTDPGEVATPTPAPAVQSIRAYTRVAKVNVRREADGGSKLVETLTQAGTEVTITGQSEDRSGTFWYAVRFGSGRTGYIRADLLTTDPSDVVITPSPTPTPGSSSYSYNSQPVVQETRAYTRIAKVNVRRAADEGSKLVETLARAGTSVTITGMAEDKKGTLWYAVRFGSGRSGYIRSDLLTTNPSEIIITPAPTPTPGSVPDSYYSVPAVQETRAYTRIAKVNVRRNADTGSRLVETLARAGTEVTITGVAEDQAGTLWYAVRLGSGKTGYIRADLLTTNPYEVAAAPTPTPVNSSNSYSVRVVRETQAYTRVEKVNVRREASANSRLVTRLDKAGTAVTVTGGTTDRQGAGWSSVRLANGSIGYIRDDLLTMDPAEIVTPSPSPSPSPTPSPTPAPTPAPSPTPAPVPATQSDVQWEEIYLKDLQWDKMDSDAVALRSFRGSEIAALPAGTVLGRYTFRSGSGMLSTRMVFTKPVIPARLEAKLKERNETWILYIKEDDTLVRRLPSLVIFPVTDDGTCWVEYHWSRTYVIDSLRLASWDLDSWYEVDWNGSEFSAYTINCPGMYFEIDTDYGFSVENQVTETFFPIPDSCLNLLINELDHPSPYSRDY